MNRMVSLVLLAAVVLGGVSCSEKRAVIFFVQAVRGTNQAKPDEPKWRAIGPRLGKDLSSVFAWKHYWEVSHCQVAVPPEQPMKARITPERELEIKLAPGQEVELRLYRKGELRQEMRMSVDSPMTILGGDSANHEGWFIVVRRDRPSID